MAVKLQRHWKAIGVPLAWVTIATLTTPEEIKSGERMAAADPDIYRVVEEKSDGTVRQQ